MGDSSGSRGARTARRVAAVALVLALAPLLSGCAVFKTFHGGAQLDTIGSVVVTSTVCTSRPDLPSSPCPRTSFVGSAENISSPVSLQLLLGYRIPADSQPPASFTSTGSVALTFQPSDSYASELQRLQPAPAGEKWVGYASTSTFTYQSSMGVKEGTVVAAFTLPPAVDGGPFQTPFRFRPVVGVRGVASPSSPISRPVKCDNNLMAASDSNSTACVSDTGPQFGTSAAAPITGYSSLSTRDLGFPSAGVSGSANPGGLVTLPFIARYSGTAIAAATFSLTASTALPGATASPTITTFAPPNNSDTPIPVAVGVPAGAAPGTYDVTLTAKLANGQTRAGVGKLTVVAPAGGGGGGGGGGTSGGGGGGPTAGALKLTIILPPKLAARSARRSGVRVLVGSSARTRATVELFCGKRRAPLARRRGVLLRAPGPVAVILKSARLRPGACRVVVRGTGYRATKALRLRRP
jgi:hypothetical protein